MRGVGLLHERQTDTVKHSLDKTHSDYQPKTSVLLNGTEAKCMILRAECDTLTNVLIDGFTFCHGHQEAIEGHPLRILQYLANYCGGGVAGKQKLDQ